MHVLGAAEKAFEELKRLWQIDGVSRPGPKALHSARSIARVGIALADEEGLSALSMRKIAAQLSVSAMSLYTHLPGKAELLEVMVDEVAGEISSPEGNDWSTRATSIAWSNWEWLLRHPWLLGLDSHRPVLGPNTIRKYEQELFAFDGLGITDVEMDFALGSLLALVKGCAMAAIDMNGALKQGAETDLDWWKARQPILDKLNLEARFPLASRVGSAVGAYAGASQAPVDTFRVGLQIWLSGMEAFLTIRQPDMAVQGHVLPVPSTSEV